MGGMALPAAVCAAGAPGFCRRIWQNGLEVQTLGSYCSSRSPVAQPFCSPGLCPHLAFSSPVKEEEKQKLLQRGSELQSEHQQLEERDRRLASAVKVRWVWGAGGRGTLEPRDLSPEPHCSVLEAPGGDRLPSIISKPGGRQCGSVTCSAESCQTEAAQLRSHLALRLWPGPVSEPQFLLA